MTHYLKHILSAAGLAAFVMFAAASGEGEPKDGDDTGGTDGGTTTGDTPVVDPVCDHNDDTYELVGGRNICKRECLPNEVGPTGNECETKEDPANGELFCDCGV